jgi:hypothetical protein
MPPVRGRPNLGARPPAGLGRAHTIQEATTVFIIDCPDLDRDVLVLDDQIHALSHTPNGTATEFVCSCGSWAVYLTGPIQTSGHLIFHQAIPAAA